MNQIKVVIKTHFELLIMTGCVLLVIGILFLSKTEFGMGIFGKTGTTFSPLVKDDELVNGGTDHLDGIVKEYIPSIQYNKGALKMGDCVEFKRLLTVVLEDGTITSGSTEYGFAIYLTDIRTNAGNSVLEKMSTDELANMEEIPSAFVYDKDLDMLYIFGSGTYTVLVKIYTDAGAMETYEFQLPVELQ